MSRNLKIGNYTILYSVGSGSFGTVYMAVNDTIGMPVAIKEISKSVLKTEKERFRLEREKSIMKMAMHQYIVELFEVIEDDEYIFLVMEFAKKGSLKSLLAQTTYFNEATCRQIFSQLLIAVGYLHNDLKVIHRDLKAENILIDDNSNIRLIDFGLSTNSDPSIQKTACGSPAYAAPEVITHDNYTESADIWSLGVLLFLMATGRFPFDTSSITKLLNEVITVPIQIPTTLSTDLQDLLSKLLQKEPAKRITIEGIVDHPWLKRHGYFAYKPSHGRHFSDSLIIDDSIDIQIMEELTKSGIDVKELRNSLMKHDFKCLYALYRIKRRAKVMVEFIDKAKTLNDSASSDNNMTRFFSMPLKDTANLVLKRPYIRKSFIKSNSTPYNDQQTKLLFCNVKGGKYCSPKPPLPR